MPTQHVDPSCHGELLQEVATSLLKARKVVVVTGAGISTNSGIPDFRSENGLYSLIQAHYDAARQSNDQQAHEDDDNERPQKRKKLADADPEVESESASEDDAGPDDLEGCLEDISRRSSASSGGESENIITVLGSPRQQLVAGEVDGEITTVSHSHQSTSTPKTRRKWPLHNQGPTSPPSSPPLDSARSKILRSRNLLLEEQFVRSSSPLSSPPPLYSDPFEDSLHSESTRRSTSPSVGDSPPPKASQYTHLLTQRASTLPRMQGKDLFDAQIWSDPLRTSVFYTFATTLRQKIREAEPTSSHKFIGHLRDRGKLVRCYTQNIDMIEEKVGLSTSLDIGAGARGRFSRKSTGTNSQLSKMVEEATELSSQSTSDSSQQSSQAAPDQSEATPAHLSRPKSQLLRSGVECVFLHGSLEQLRCFHCSRLCSWDDPDREAETLSGEQPECPHCANTAAAREESGKRALGVGKLRPDIVLYGEEHPSAHLISPIVTHDLNLCPDMLLILGTSLKVHGLKTMVREFSKAVHTKGGKVVFVNFTKPSDSIWGEVIDFWVEWDCDAWVSDLQERVPGLWDEHLPGPPKLKRISSGMTEEEKEKLRQARRQVKEQEKEAKDKERARVKAMKELERDKIKKEKQDEKQKAREKREEERSRARKAKEAEKQRKEKEKGVPANPTALRDTKVAGAYWSQRMVEDLRRITSGLPLGQAQLPQLRAEGKQVPSSAPGCGPAIPNLPSTKRGARKSAPYALEHPKQVASTLNPSHERVQRPTAPQREGLLCPSSHVASFGTPLAKGQETLASVAECTSNLPSDASPDSLLQSSIRDSVKGRKRKRTWKAQTMDQKAAHADTGRTVARESDSVHEKLVLPPLRSEARSAHDRKLEVLEPFKAPVGPLGSISPNRRTARKMGRSNSFYLDNPLAQMQLLPYLAQLKDENTSITHEVLVETERQGLSQTGAAACPIAQDEHVKKESESVEPKEARETRRLPGWKALTSAFKSLTREN